MIGSMALALAGAILHFKYILPTQDQLKAILW